ncbi:MAG: YigZ family protein [Spirochaetia bacterium]|nr:YigZ family protein [Spirochaetia bacterium]
MRYPTETIVCEIEVKKSRFIGIGQYISSIDEIKDIIRHLRSEHSGANHVVHAAIVGKTGEMISFSDDKEPKNTAGRPVYEVVKGSLLTNILVCVVRYFGGTLLGTGGLVKAYTQAAQEVTLKIKSEELIETSTIKFTLPYDKYDKVMLFLSPYQKGLETDFLSEITITYTCETRHLEMIKKELINITQGAITFYQDAQ